MEEQELLLAKVCVLIGAWYYFTYLHKEPCRNSILQGHSYIQELLSDDCNPRRAAEGLRMPFPTFRLLMQELQQRNFLVDSRYVSAEEKLAIFLHIVGHKSSNRLVQERFQHSGETISR